MKAYIKTYIKANIKTYIKTNIRSCIDVFMTFSYYLCSICVVCLSYLFRVFRICCLSYSYVFFRFSPFIGMVDLAAGHINSTNQTNHSKATKPIENQIETKKRKTEKNK